MNVLWVTDKYLDISIDRVTWTETTKILFGKKHQIVLIAGSKSPSKPDYGLKQHIVNISAFPFKKSGQILFHGKMFIRTARHAYAQKPEVLFFHPSVFLTLLPFLVLKKMGATPTKFVLDVRTLPLGLSAKIVKTVFGLSMTLSKHFCDGVTVITPFMKTVLSEQYRLHKNKIGVWTSGVALDHFLPGATASSAKKRLIQELGIQGKFVVMYHGVLSADRGLQNCIEAMVPISKNHPDIVLMLIGEGGAKTLLQDMVKVSGLKECVFIAGPVPYEVIPDYVELSDVGILPFPRDLWWRVSSPIKLMEYLAMCKPVIVTEIEAHRDVLDGHPFGFFIANNHPSEIAKGIERAYRQRQRLPGIGKQGRILVQKHYTWNAQVSCLEKYLNSIIKNELPN